VRGGSRAPAAAGRPAAQVPQNPLDNRSRLDQRDQRHPTRATGTRQHIEPEPAPCPARSPAATSRAAPARRSPPSAPASGPVWMARAGRSHRPTAAPARPDADPSTPRRRRTRRPARPVPVPSRPSDPRKPCRQATAGEELAKLALDKRWQPFSLPASARPLAERLEVIAHEAMQDVRMRLTRPIRERRGTHAGCLRKRRTRRCDRVRSTRYGRQPSR
jgi:hypothetical protein